MSEVDVSEDVMDRDDKSVVPVGRDAFFYTLSFNEWDKKLSVSYCLYDKQELRKAIHFSSIFWFPYLYVVMMIVTFVFLLWNHMWFNAFSCLFGAALVWFNFRYFKTQKIGEGFFKTFYNIAESMILCVMSDDKKIKVYDYVIKNVDAVGYDHRMKLAPVDKVRCVELVSSIVSIDDKLDSMDVESVDVWDNIIDNLSGVLELETERQEIVEELFCVCGFDGEVVSVVREKV